MRSDGYLKIILTIIAVELAWIGVRDLAPPVSAQGPPTRVVIAGVELEASEFLPVAVMGGSRQLPASLERLRILVDTTQPLRVDAPQPLRVLPVGTIKVETNKPLLVENVPYTPSRRPGE